MKIVESLEKILKTTPILTLGGMLDWYFRRYPGNQVYGLPIQFFLFYFSLCKCACRRPTKFER